MRVPKWWPLVWRSTFHQEQHSRLAAEALLKGAKADLAKEKAQRFAVTRAVEAMDGLRLALKERGLPDLERIEMCNEAVDGLKVGLHDHAESFHHGEHPAQGYQQLAFMGIPVVPGAAPGSVVLVPQEATHE